MLKKTLLTVLVLNLVVLASCSTIEKQQRTVYETDIQADGAINIQQDNSDAVLRVATLNLAHGRKDGTVNLTFLERSIPQSDLDH